MLCTELDNKKNHILCYNLCDAAEQMECDARTTGSNIFSPAFAFECVPQCVGVCETIISIRQLSGKSERDNQTKMST